MISMPLLQRAAFVLAFGSAFSIVFSIAVSNILLALAVAALLLSGEKLRFPPIGLPLALFAGGTLLSLLLSAEPSLANPQIRKFFVFLTLLVVSSTFRTLGDVRKLMLAWAGIAAVAAVRSFLQFADKMDEAQRLGRPFYDFYVPERTTGFMSHWMTFGGQQMIVLLLLGALLFWAPAKGWLRTLLAVIGIVIGVSILLNLTRGIWLGTAAGGLYLMWSWRRWLVLVAPLVLVLGIWLGPDPVRERILSAARPKAQIDSNQHRIVTWRTGWEMIKAHPLFGLGPEQVNKQFTKYIPPDVPMPLPEGWYGHLHNIYLHYAAERGIPTMLALMWLMGRIVADFRRALRKLRDHEGLARAVLHGGIAVVISILVTGIFELNLGDSEVLILFLATVGCGYLAVKNAGTEQPAEEQVVA